MIPVKSRDLSEPHRRGMLALCDCQTLEHTADMHYYVQPLVVGEVPGSMTTGERVAKLNTGEAVKGVTTATLDNEAAAFLASGDRLLLLLGEAGSGKSMFTWLTVQRCLQAFEAAATELQTASASSGGNIPGSGSGSSNTGSGSPKILWVPIVVDLKQYKVSELAGLVPRFLRDVCHMSDADAQKLREGVTPLPTLPRVGVVVICDGFDELQAEESDAVTKAARARLRDFFSVVAATAHNSWAAGSLKVVVTTRESRLGGRADEDAVFGKHRRCVLLPFNDAQVLRWLAQY